MEEPDRDNCDRCGKFAWEEGIPSWTCQQNLYCEKCSDAINTEREEHEEQVWVKTFSKHHLN